MGYDTSHAIFSPDGRLIQVERAQLASEQGSLVVFSKQVDHIAVSFEKRTGNKLLIEDDINKIVLIDPIQNIFMTFSGFSPDFNIITNQARFICRYYRYKTGENINIEQLARELASFKQKNTVESKVRPYGVRSIIFGFSEEYQIYMVEPDGNYSEYNRGAIGNKHKVVMEHFENTKEHENDVLEGVFLVAQNDVNKVCGFKIKQDGVEMISSEYVKNYLQELAEQNSK